MFKNFFCCGPSNTNVEPQKGNKKILRCRKLVHCLWPTPWILLWRSSNWNPRIHPGCFKQYQTKSHPELRSLELRCNTAASIPLASYEVLETSIKQLTHGNDANTLQVVERQQWDIVRDRRDFGRRRNTVVQDDWTAHVDCLSSPVAINRSRVCNTVCWKLW